MVLDEDYILEESHDHLSIDISVFECPGKPPSWILVDLPEVHNCVNVVKHLAIFFFLFFRQI